MTSHASIEVGGRSIALDADGHLADASDWAPDVARALAARDGIDLDEPRWWMIEFVRRHHDRYGMPPLLRTVVAAMRSEIGPADASTRLLYRMFPEGPLRQACCYAGLPCPEACI